MNRDRDTNRLNRRRCRDRGCPREALPVGAHEPFIAEAAETAFLQLPGVQIRREPLGHRDLGLGAVVGKARCTQTERQETSDLEGFLVLAAGVALPGCAGRFFAVRKS